MIQFKANIRSALAASDDAITTGSVGIPVQLQLATEFDGLAKTFCAKNGSAAVDIVLTGDATETVIPPDVLQTTGLLQIGVYAARADGEIVIPTVWASVEVVSTGVSPSGIDPTGPTPSWAAQVQQEAENAVTIAESVEASIAPTFSNATAYSAGDYVYHSGTLYVFTADHAAGEWMGTDVMAAVIGEDISGLKNALNFVAGGSLNPSDLAWQQGGVGNPTATTRICTTNYITFPKTLAYFSVPTGYAINVRVYNSSNIQESVAGTSQTDYLYIVTDPSKKYKFEMYNSSGMSVGDESNLTITLQSIDDYSFNSFRDPYEHYGFSTVSGFWVSTDKTRMSNRTAYYFTQPVTVRASSPLDLYIAYWKDSDTTDIANYIANTGWLTTGEVYIPAETYFTVTLKMSTGKSLVKESISNTNLVIIDNVDTRNFDEVIDKYITPLYATALSLTDWQQGGLGNDGSIYQSANRISSLNYHKYNSDGFIRLHGNQFSVNAQSYRLENGTYTLVESFGNTFTWSLDIPIDQNLYYRFGMYSGNGATVTDYVYLSANIVYPYVTSVEAEPIFNEAVIDGLWKVDADKILTELSGDFVFAVQSDTHLDLDNSSGKNWSYPSYANNLRLFASYTGLDFAANLGDLIEGYATDTTADMRKDMTDAVRRYCYPRACPMLFAVGNHDTSYLFANGDASKIIQPSELHRRIFKPMQETGNFIFPTASANYYYCDFANDIRVIVLNTCDVTEGSAPTGSAVFNISAEQIAWFEGVLNNSAGKRLIVLSHVPLVSSQSPDVPSGASSIIAALENYSGEVIACIAGHTHAQASAKVNGINYIVCTWQGASAEVFSVDTTAKTINTKMVGAYWNYGTQTRNFTY